MTIAREALDSHPQPRMGAPALREYEGAAVSIGRLDAIGAAAPQGLRRLLGLRCAASALGASETVILALLRPEREGAMLLLAYHEALREGSVRARGGVIPSLGVLHELLALAPPPEDVRSRVDSIIGMRDLPPLFRAAHAAGAILGSLPALGESPIATGAVELASLAVSLILCAGGVTQDAWLTLPLRTSQALPLGRSEAGAEPDEWLAATFSALSREARSTMDGLSRAREIAEADDERVRAAFGRAALSALDVLALLRRDLSISVGDAARALSMTPPTAGAAIARLRGLGIAHEVTGRVRSRTFVYSSLVAAVAG